MSAATDAALWAAYHASCSIEDRNRLVERYMPVVRYHAERMKSKMPNHVDVDDLESYGVFGLMKAIATFDPGRGVKFETYCVPRVRGAIIDELRKLDWVPRLERKRADPETITMVTSLQEPVRDRTEGEVRTRLDMLPDRKTRKPTTTTKKRDLLQMVIKGLNKHERLIVILYYRAELTMKEIGQALGVSESRVSQVHSALLPRIRKRLEGRQEEFAL